MTRKEQIIADLVSRANDMADLLPIERRGDLFIQLLDAAFDAGGKHYHDEIVRYRSRGYQLMSAMQHLVDELRYRRVVGYSGSDSALFDHVSADVKDRIAKLMSVSMEEP